MDIDLDYIRVTIMGDDEFAGEVTMTKRFENFDDAVEYLQDMHAREQEGGKQEKQYE